jgi:membrane-associated phospholipid phosphatase
MDDVGLPVHGAATEEALFGSLPSVWLQDHVYPLSPTVFSWLVRAVHGSWFVVPWLVGLLVSWKRPQRIGSFFLCWITLHFIVNPMFALFPLQPPWMANPEVTRLVAIHAAREIPDNNPLAAMPSLHVALPLLISLWLFGERWRTPALAMLAYSALVAFEVVLSGEHYVVDVAGGVAVAVVIALGAQIGRRWLFSRPSEGPEEASRLVPGVQQRTALRGRVKLGVKVPPGLTSQPGIIFLLTGALILLVSIKLALAL